MTELVFPDTRLLRYPSLLLSNGKMIERVHEFWSPTLFIDFILNSPKFPAIRPFASSVTCSKGNHSVTDCLSTNSRVSEVEVSGTNRYHYCLT